MSYLYVFGSRNESAAFQDILKSRGIWAILISTPKECMTGCGLSVKIDEHSLNLANGLFNNFRYKSTFKGVFKLDKVGIRNIVTRLR